MKWILIFSVISIYLYESYWPLPDKDKEQFEYYKPKTKMVLGVAKTHNIPIELLIFHKITDEKKFFQYLNVKDNIQYNNGEKRIISKFKRWLQCT